MGYLLTAVLCGAVLGNAFFKMGVGSINVLSLFILAAVVTYLTVFLVFRSGRIKYRPSRPFDKYLWAFFGVGVVSATLSYLGVYSAFFPTSALLRDESYIPRQAYYLFFIPMIILAGRNAGTKGTLDWVARNRTLLFFGVWALYAAFNQQLALNVQCCFALGFLLLMNREERKAVDILMLAILLFSPIAVGGEMTQVIIRAVAFGTYLIGFRSKALKYALIASLCVVLGCYVLPFLPLESFGFDANTLWRAEYWGNELTQLGETFGLGVGYGTSYASVDFVGAALTGPFAATAEYSVAEKLFVVGCHNSFVSLFFRLGIAGIAALFAYVVSLTNHTNDFRGGYASSAAFALISSLVIVCFNVGFENPSYFFLFGFSLALASSQVGNAKEEGCE